MNVLKGCNIAELNDQEINNLISAFIMRCVLITAGTGAEMFKIYNGNISEDAQRYIKDGVFMVDCYIDMDSFKISKLPDYANSYKHIGQLLTYANKTHEINIGVYGNIYNITAVKRDDQDDLLYYMCNDLVRAICIMAIKIANVNGVFSIG